MAMTDFEHAVLKALGDQQRALNAIAADLAWFKTRELNKADAIRKMAESVQIPRL
jgi:hypothetical protein